MDIGGQRRSDNFEDRGAGRTRRGGGVGVSLLATVMRYFGLKGVLVVGLLLGGAYLIAPDGVKDTLFGGGDTATAPGTKVCQSSQKNAAACDFSRAVLASTEDVWARKFAQDALPDYGRRAPSEYREPTLVVFTGGVSTGCGNASSALGPFYCPRDNNLYIDPSFYDDLARKLNAPGDFAQAYVVAHEVAHHVQNLIGATSIEVPGESREQTSVRVELQADCFAGVWGHSARADLSITDDDLAEATQAAHAIGDDALGHRDESRYTHGSSEQRIRWFRRGFESGDPGQCDTFAARKAMDL